MQTQRFFCIKVKGVFGSFCNRVNAIMFKISFNDFETEMYNKSSSLNLAINCPIFCCKSNNKTQVIKYTSIGDIHFRFF